MKLTHLLAATAASVLLAACGGGNDTVDDIAMPQASNEVPASATSTVTSYAEYVGSLEATESGAPKDVSKVVPPTSETKAPIAVI